ncbi:hypothetical protein CLIB1423_10S02872 [[Candida] railenensis]|uniref:EF-hand domain-containing protein n=1 Tax=[Candida] railenensis TaxID=45579 RepID=A0A9P0QR22_9ASCO|nr:hypothetical protein CLIB1423_10S02872 [[Candida] railenensis]
MIRSLYNFSSLGSVVAYLCLGSFRLSWLFGVYMLRARIPSLLRSLSSIAPSSTIKHSFESVERELQSPTPNWNIVEDFLSKKLAKESLEDFRIVENKVKERSSGGTPPSIYQLLIRACYKEKRVGDAVDLYIKVASMNSVVSGASAPAPAPASSSSSVEKVVHIDKFNHERIINYLLKAISHSNDFIDLFKLKVLWENFIYINTKAPNTELLYFASFINILLNTGQIEMALDKFKLSYNSLSMDDSHSNDSILKVFPTIRILDQLSADGNFDEMYNILQMILGEEGNYEVVPLDHWFVYLSNGLSKNHYNLVKLIYDTVIMGGYEEGEITTESALFSPSHELMSTDKFLIMNSLTDELTLQILHTFSSNGDVPSTLSLIESHFIHKKLKGERALTRELCVCIVKAYCFSDELQENWPEVTLDNQVTPSPIDHSVERVLDVLDEFIRKLEKEEKGKISYKDISDCMSFKFKNFKILDSKIEAKRTGIAKSSKETDFVDNEKLSNPNIESSAQGNVLANLDTLTLFVLNHIQHLQDKRASISTIKLFVNCLLNHVNLYQNLSGVVRVLTTLHKQNSRLLDEWLDSDSIDIILNATSKSSAGKYISYELFKHLRKRQTLISSQQYVWLTNSILRDDFHECLQFYLFNYLKDCGVVDNKMLLLLRQLPPAAVNMNDKTKSLVGFMETNANRPVEADVVNDFWRVNELKETFPEHISGKAVPELGRKYHKYIDVRDVEYVKYIFG